MDAPTNQTLAELKAVPDAPPASKELRWASGRPLGSSGRRNAAFEHARRYQNGRPRALKCGEVLRSCHAAALGATAVQRLVALATYFVERGDDTDEAAAEALEQAFGLGGYEGAGECEDDAKSLVQRITWAQNYGFGLLGETWEADGLYWPRGFETIYADSIVGWVEDPETRRIVAAKQRVRGKSETTDIPLDQVLYVVRLRDEGGAEGVPLLRHVFPQYDSWLEAVRAQDVSIQRFAVPTPVSDFLPDVGAQYGFGVPANATPDQRAAAQQRLQAEVDRMDKLLAEYTSHERARLVKSPWWKVELFGGADRVNPALLQPVIDAKERAILEMYLHGWLASGRAGAGGAYSMIETQRDAALDAAVADVEWALKAINSQIVARFMRFNFSKVPRRRWPRIGFKFPQRAAFVRHFDKVVQAVGTGLLTPVPEDERDVRAGFGLGDLPPEAEARGVTERLRNQAVTTARARQEAERPAARDLVARGRRSNTQTEEVQA